MTKLELQKLISQLASLGEDKDELDLWYSIFDDLELAEQQELVANLENELHQLQQVH